MTELIDLIDEGLGRAAHKEVVRADEVIDLLLDLRKLATTEAAWREHDELATV